MKKLKIGISACLIGLKYRYDGTSRYNQALIDKLAQKVDFIPVCPEVECGLSIPRPPMRIEVSPRGTRMKVIETGEDVTGKLLEWAPVKLRQLEELDIAAFLFKAKSPSCGLASTPLYDARGHIITGAGSGIFAHILRQKFPRMIVGEDVDLEYFVSQLSLDLIK